jgi:hypothetical protein
MKKIFFTSVLVLLFIGCSSDSNSEGGLPLETQKGANTFGCLIDGQLLVPRSGNNDIVNPLWGAILWGGIPNVYDYRELEIRDFKSTHNTSFLLHIKGVDTQGVGEYSIDESNGMNNIDGLDHTYLHCTIFDKKTNSYQQYVSYENSGILEIKYLRLNGLIISGIFNCRVRNIQNPDDEKEITNGRFDIESHTIMQKYFP